MLETVQAVAGVLLAVVIWAGTSIAIYSPFIYLGLRHYRKATIRQRESSSWKTSQSSPISCVGAMPLLWPHNRCRNTLGNRQVG